LGRLSSIGTRRGGRLEVTTKISGYFGFADFLKSRYTVLLEVTTKISGYFGIIAGGVNDITAM